jgi:two-component system sensor histidine kinase DesK
MRGVRFQAGWLSASGLPKSENAVVSDPAARERETDAAGPPLVTAGVPGGPRLARAIVIAVLCAFVAVQVIDELTAPFPSRAKELTIGFISLALLFGLTLTITSPAAEHWPLWRRRVILLAQAVVTYLPLLYLFQEWAGMAGFFAGSTLLLFSGWTAWVLFAAAIGSMFVLPLIEHLGPYLVAYFSLSTLTIGLVVFGLTRLSLLISYVHATRGELAQLAIVRERMRFARDLHDLLGYSLSAIILKAELTRRLVGSNPARARDELAEMLDTSRQALADVRLVASGYRNISMAKEASAVTSLLATAGITADIEVNCGALDEKIDTVLATVLREAVTNMLRHSAAHQCQISADQVGDAIHLLIRNDGVPAGAASGRSGGGLENLASRLTAVGGQLTTTVRGDGWFELLAEAPDAPRQAADEPSAR